MESVLEPLSGRSREVMEAILKNVDTTNLEEGYNTFIGRVLRETEADDSEKEDEVLAESEEKKDEALKEGVVLTGDTDETAEESINESEDPGQKERLERIKRLAGIK